MNSAFQTIIGHKKQCEYLRQILESDKIAHAYSFSGSKGLGKATIAKEFAAHLLEVDIAKLQTSPNVTILDNEDGKIGVEEVRSLKQTLSLSTLGGGWKIAIIDGADKMTVPAQNALLKTLEEPTPKTVIILISHNSNALLETIESRVVNIAFQLLSQNLIKETLEERFSLTQDRAELLAQLSMGRPGFALSCSDDESCKDYEELAIEALQFLQSPLYARMKKVEELTKRKEDRQQVIKNMIELMRMWLHEGLQVHLNLSKSTQAKVLASELSMKSMKSALETLQVCENALVRNVQPALALQVFASSF